MGKEKKNRNKNKDITDSDYSGLYLKIIKSGIYLALLLPLIIIPWFLYPFQFGKVIIFRMIIEAITFFYILLIFKKPEYRPRWGLLQVSIAVFVGVLFFTSLTGVDFARSFWGTSERMGGFFSFIHYWIFFIIASSILKSREDWKKVLSISILAALISSFYAFVQSAYFPPFLGWLKHTVPFLGGIVQKYYSINFFFTINDLRPYGTIGNAGFFAAYVLFNIFFSAYLAMSGQGKRGKIIYGIVSLLLSCALFISGTRGAYLALIAGVAVLILVYFSIYLTGKTKVPAFIIDYFKNKFAGQKDLGNTAGNALVTLLMKRRSALLYMAVIFIVLSALFTREAPQVKENYIFSRFASISSQDNSAKMRFYAWNSAWQGFKDRPILGWGPENFSVVFNKNFNPLYFGGYGYVSLYDRAHNIFLDVAVTSGVLGILSYLGIFACLYIILFRAYRRTKENPAVFGLIFAVPVAYFVQDFFWFDDFSAYLMLFLFLAFSASFFSSLPDFDAGFKSNRIGLFVSSGNRYLKLRNRKNLSGEALLVFKFFSALIIIVAMYFANWQLWVFQKKLTLASAAFDSNRDDAFLWYNQAMADSTYLGREEAYQRLGEFVINNYAQRNFESPDDLRNLKENLNFTIREIKNAMREDPYDIQFYRQLGRLYNIRYDYFRDSIDLSEAEKVLEKGLELSPTRETLYYELGQTMIFKKEYPKGIELLKKAVELNPPVMVSHWYLIMAYADSQNYPQAKEELDKMMAMGYSYPGNAKDILRVASIYVGLKDYKNAEKLYKEVLERDPYNPQIYASLAVNYKEMGDKENAKAMAEKAMALDPSYADEGKAFVDSLK